MNIRPCERAKPKKHSCDPGSKAASDRDLRPLETCTVKSMKDTSPSGYLSKKPRFQNMM